MKDNSNKNAIAIIGMSCRFPGANSITQYWSNLENGLESIVSFNKEDLETDNIDDLEYVFSKGYLSEAELFDADFFGISERKAKIISPQFRQFLECVWNVYESAGYNPYLNSDSVGVYATSTGIDSYYEKNLKGNSQIDVSDYELYINNGQDFLATFIAHHFNFTGPCINIQTACSSSLVTIIKACDDLINKKCTMAIAGGVSITFPLKSGYVYKTGMIYSKDGHCRAFSEDASGIVPGNGVGVVLLKLLDDAIRDQDHIHAIIKGYAINNDGHNKLSFAAPSVQGQYEVLKAAAYSANVSPESIEYIEAHGTGTPLGDQIEIEALKKFLSNKSDNATPCYIGSVKPNIGHLDVASGIAGFIKGVLSIENKKIPATINCNKVNSNLKLIGTRLKIVNETINWVGNSNHPRRAGVSSFGVGGTNAHIILEENQHKTELIEENEKFWIIPLSAKNEENLMTMKDNLAEYFHCNSKINLANLAKTLQNGRVNFKYRLAIISKSLNEITSEMYLPQEIIFGYKPDKAKKTAFIFSNCLSQNFSSIYELYISIPSFKKAIDMCSISIGKVYKLNILQTLTERSLEKLDVVTLKLINFATQYALAKTWISLGARPELFFGYGLGEFAAAVLSKVLTLDDGTKLIVNTAKIVQPDVKLCMLSVFISEEEMNEIIKEREIKTVAINTDFHIVIVGKENDIEPVKDILNKKEIVYQRVDQVHDFNFIASGYHDKLYKIFDEINFNQPEIPIINGLDNKYDITCTEYWMQKFTTSINYYKSISQLLMEYDKYIEIGFGEQLSKYLRQINQHKTNEKILVLNGISIQYKDSYYANFLKLVAMGWVAGINIKWTSLYDNQLLPYKKIQLPTYAFTRIVQSISKRENVKQKMSIMNFQNTSAEEWLYYPKWYQRIPFKLNAINETAIIITHDEYGYSNMLVKRLKLSGNYVFIKIPTFTRSLAGEMNDDTMIARTAIWLNAIRKIANHNKILIIHNTLSKNSNLQKRLNNSFYDLIAFSRSLEQLNEKPYIRIISLTNGSVKVHSEDKLIPEASCIMGPLLCLSNENPQILTRCIDVNLNEKNEDIIEQLFFELNVIETKSIIALRNGLRYGRAYVPSAVGKNESLSTIKLQRHGVYLITGGLGGIGLAFSKYLAKVYKANIILISRSIVPDSHEWIKIANHPSSSEKTMSMINNLIEIKKYANDLMIFSADVSSYESMFNVYEKAKERFGKINGVIHAASNSDGMIERESTSSIKRQFDAKIVGLKVLERVFKIEPLDFMILFSALNTIRGGVGISSYIASNAYLNTFAEQYHKKLDYPIVSINWDAWKETGMRYNFLNRKHNNILPLNVFDGENENQKNYYPNNQWWKFIEEHQLNNKFVIPTSLMIELTCNTAQKMQEKKFPISLSNFSFLQPGIIKKMEDYKLNTAIDINKNRISTEITSNKKIKQLSHSILQAVPNMLPLFDINYYTDMLNSFETIDSLGDEDISDPYHDMSIFKPRWCINWIKQQGKFFLANIKLKEEYRREETSLILHPSLLDIALGYHSRFLKSRHSVFYIDELKVHNSLTDIFYSLIHVRWINENVGTCLCDVAVFQLNNQIIAEAKGLTLKRIDSTKEFLKGDELHVS